MVFILLLSNLGKNKSEDFKNLFTLYKLENFQLRLTVFWSLWSKEQSQTIKSSSNISIFQSRVLLFFLLSIITQGYFFSLIFKERKGGREWGEREKHHVRKTCRLDASCKYSYPGRDGTCNLGTLDQESNPGNLALCVCARWAGWGERRWLML